jgi:hypothetical protein
MEGGSCEAISYTEELAELEKYVLNQVLQWKLSYCTPFDYIQLIVDHLYTNKEINLILSKAVQVSELLLICILCLIVLANEMLKSYTPYCIALASLFTAVKLERLNESALLELIKDKKVRL